MQTADSGKEGGEGEVKEKEMRRRRRLEEATRGAAFA
jgi:hypothetical protein